MSKLKAYEISTLGSYLESVCLIQMNDKVYFARENCDGEYDMALISNELAEKIMQELTWKEITVLINAEGKVVNKE